MYQNLRIEWDYGDIPKDYKEEYTPIGDYVSALARQIDSSLTFETKEKALEYFRPYIEDIQARFNLSYDEDYDCYSYSEDRRTCTAELATLCVEEIYADGGSDFIITFLCTYHEDEEKPTDLELFKKTFGL